MRQLVGLYSAGGSGKEVDLGNLKNLFLEEAGVKYIYISK